MKRKMAKRKPTKREVAKSPRPSEVPEKSLLELWERGRRGPLELIPPYTTGVIDGVSLPKDLEAVIGFHAGECMLGADYYMEGEPWFYWWLALAIDGQPYDHGCAGIETSYPRYHFYGERPPGRIDEDGNDLSDPSGWKDRSMALTKLQKFAVGVALRDAMREGFFLAILRYADDLKTSAQAAVDRQYLELRHAQVLKQRRENGELLAEEGRAAKAANDIARAKHICSLYKRIRPSKPDGSRGNGGAIRDVVERYESHTRESITPRAVREILKRHGMMPARRKGKN